MIPTRDFLLGAAGLFVIALALVLYIVTRPVTKIPRSRRRLVGEDEQGLKGRFNSAVERLDRSQGSRLAIIAAPLDEAGLETDPARAALILSGAVVVFALLGFVVGGLPLALLMVLLIPLAWRAYMALRISRRRSAFADQLDDTLQMLAASLRAGFGLLQALAATATDAEEPTQGELTRVLNETRVGFPLTDSLENLAKRLANDDFHWVAQAIAINREVGGNLADVLDGVAQTIRERNNLRRQVRSLSAEGRTSAAILYALPVIFGLIMLVISPAYISVLFSSVIGWGILAVAGLMMLIGGLWLINIVNIKY